MNRFIVRVDDCGWVPPHKTDDRGLLYFRKWREAARLSRERAIPIYYGFIPITMCVRDLVWLRDNLHAEERIAVHGWDHVDGAVVSLYEMFHAQGIFRVAGLRVPESYIAPFNRYTTNTVRDWGNALSEHCHELAAVFFGGFPDDPQSIDVGERPAMVWESFHLPAYKPLYGRARELIDRVDAIPEFPYPLVLTLHATWDEHDLPAVGELLAKIWDRVVTVDAAIDWVREQGGWL